MADANDKREQRLKTALRDNLRKRKSQSRGPVEKPESSAADKTAPPEES